MMMENPNFAGINNGGGITTINSSFYDHINFYQKLSASSEPSDMSVSSSGSLTTSSIAGLSSVASNNNSLTTMLNHDQLRHTNGHTNGHTGHSVLRRTHHRVSHNEDALAQALMDPRFATQPLENYYEWTLDLRKLNVGLPFAQGAFGKLYRGTYNSDDVAIKLLEKPERDLERAQLMEQQFAQEVTMLANLKHDNIVRFVGACRKPMVWCIVTEYAKGGSVRNFLMRRRNGTVPLKTAVQQALDVARGMEYVHGFGLIHRDLKSDNLLISADKSIKIADFGVARIEVKNEGMTPETGTYRWMAPEMIQHRPYDQKVDVYSFGIVLWELITGCLPFSNMTAVQAAFAVVNKNARPAIPPDCLPVLTEIMTRCWDADPSVRPSFGEVVRMLEIAQMEIVTTVRKARFRCCMHLPMTTD
ncbi:hypothetical protein LUZ60_002548 [Juncus effusus]|nr:hypothetical protein LUZ60_002548 [Juncus effusus]